MQTKKKVVIVGAGPAGLSAAIELAENKDFEVTVLEKNDRPSYKICGGGIHPDFIKEMAGHDVMDREFSELKITTPKSSYSMGYGGVIFTGTLNRKTLNEKLTEKALGAGAEIIFGQTVKEIKDGKVITADEEFSFDYLIGADGTNSAVRKSLGISTQEFLIAFQYMIPGNYDEMEIHLDFKKFGVTYSWIFPQKGIISVGTGYSAAESRSPEDMRSLRENFDAWCRERFDLKDARFEGFSINYDYRGFEFGNVFLIGDAGGFASGLTGEGIKPAIWSGIDAARKIQDPKYKCGNIKRCMKTKKREDKLLRLLIDPRWGKIFTPIASTLFNFKWFKKMLFKVL